MVVICSRPFDRRRINPFTRLQAIFRTVGDQNTADEINVALDALGVLREQIEPDFQDPADDLIGKLIQRLGDIKPV